MEVTYPDRRKGQVVYDESEAKVFARRLDAFDTWSVGKIRIPYTRHVTNTSVTELSVRHSDHQETGGDLEGARVPPG